MLQGPGTRTAWAGGARRCRRGTAPGRTRRPRKSGAVAGLEHEQLIHHGQLAGHAGVDHGVVDVADHRVVQIPGRDVEVGAGFHRLALALAPARVQAQPRLLPEGLVRPVLVHVQGDVEITVAVGDHIHAGGAHGHREARVAHAPAHRAADDVDDVVEGAFLEVQADAGLAEHPPDQEHRTPRAIAPVGLDHPPAAPPAPARRTRQEPQHLAQAAVQLPWSGQVHRYLYDRGSPARPGPRSMSEVNTSRSWATSRTSSKRAMW